MDVENVIDYRIDKTTLDGVETLVLRCPGCDTWQYLDDDQALGRVSTECAEGGCGFHEAEDFWALRRHAETRWGPDYHPRHGDPLNAQWDAGKRP